MLKNIQSLPSKTANSVTYLLLGAVPIEAELEKPQLNTNVFIIRWPLPKILSCKS